MRNSFYLGGRPDALNALRNRSRVVFDAAKDDGSGSGSGTPATPEKKPTEQKSDDKKDAVDLAEYNRMREENARLAREKADSDKKLSDAEEARLKEEGKWKELAEKKDKDLQLTQAEHRAKIEKVAFRAAISERFVEVVGNVRVAKSLAKLVGTDGMKLDDGGNVVGLDEAIKRAMSEDPELFDALKKPSSSSDKRKKNADGYNDDDDEDDDGESDADADEDDDGDDTSAENEEEEEEEEDRNTRAGRKREREKRAQRGEKRKLSPGQQRKKDAADRLFKQIFPHQGNSGSSNSSNPGKSKKAGRIDLRDRKQYPKAEYEKVKRQMIGGIKRESARKQSEAFTNRVSQMRELRMANRGKKSS